VSIVSLRSNQLKDQHMKAIGECLSNLTAPSPAIQYLSLWDNQITDQGATFLASALKTNRSLISLNLGKNNIGLEGFQAIAGALTRAVLTPAEANNRRKVVKDIEKKKKEAVLKFRKSKPVPDERAVEIYGRPFDQQMDDLSPVEEDGVCYGRGNRILASLNLSHNLVSREDAEAVFAEVHKHNTELRRLILSIEELLPETTEDEASVLNASSVNVSAIFSSSIVELPPSPERTVVLVEPHEEIEIA
jgi:hypothetical protein